MTTLTDQPGRRDSLNIRIPAETRALIDRAAHASGATRTDFILSAARRAAEDALLDRTLFVAGPEAHAAFVARIDAPPQLNDKLRQTMQTPSPWDAGPGAGAKA